MVIQESTLSVDGMSALLAAFRRDLAIECKTFTSSNSEAIAFALNGLFRMSGVHSDLKIITRKTLDGDDGHLIENNRMCHVVVECLGTTWDANGPEAYERCCEGWHDKAGQKSSFQIANSTYPQILRIRASNRESIDYSAVLKAIQCLRTLTIDDVGGGEADEVEMRPVCH